LLQERAYKYQRVFQDRRIALSIDALIATLVLISNIILLGIAISGLTYDEFKEVLYKGTGVIQEGSCDAVRRSGNILHVAINILSTLLLGASNFTMQCLVAPTRRDIDKAHSEGKWLDIGVPSIKNLPYIPRVRKWMWDTTWNK